MFQRFWCYYPLLFNFYLRKGEYVLKTNVSDRKMLHNKSVLIKM